MRVLSYNTFIIIFWFINVPFFSVSAQRIVNPKNYGLLESNTPEKNYQILYKCHKDAVDSGYDVSYKGIDSLTIEIPEKAKSIPISNCVDFANLLLTVINTQKDGHYLFTMHNRDLPVKVDKKQIDKGNFRHVAELRRGLKLLLITDDSLWVDNRIGYTYGHKRKDILLLKDGIAQNRVIAPYNTAESLPVCTYLPVDNRQKTIGNLKIVRSGLSTKRSYVFDIDKVNNFLLHDIKLITPENKFYGDQAIRIRNCSNVTLSNIYTRGAYSQNTKYGYVFNFSNLWNTRLNNVDSEAAWGVIGTNNMNHTALSECSLNRFDIHCYGRDVMVNDCIFKAGSRSWYCGGSAIYGSIHYNRCIFDNTSPFENGTSYKTYVKSQIKFNDCKIMATAKRNYIFGTARFDKQLNSRPSLSKRYLPDIEINNLEVFVPNNVPEFYILSLGKDISYPYIEELQASVKIKGLKVVSDSLPSPVRLKLSNINKQLKKNIHLILEEESCNYSIALD